MKKLFYGCLFLALVGIGFISCNKEDNLISDSQVNTQEEIQASLSTIDQLEEKERKYTWVNEKLDCSQAGKGCIVKSLYHSVNGEVNLSEIQVLKLIEIGNVNLNQYFVHNDLSYEFPTLYESDMQVKIASNEFVLDFEFPYFKITNSQGVLEKVFNYETTLSNNDVLAALQNDGEYTKKVEFNTDPNKPAVWKCVVDGDNCKVNSISFNAQWLADNPQYLFAPTNENFESTEIDEDGIHKRVIVKTVSGNHFGIQF